MTTTPSDHPLGHESQTRHDSGSIGATDLADVEQTPPPTGEYAVCWLDLQGRVTRWSPGAEELFSLDSERAEAGHFRDLFTGEDRAEGIPQRVLSQVQQSGSWDGMGWRVKSDGRRFWTSSTVTLVHTPNGLPIGLMVVTRRLTPLAMAQPEDTSSRTASRMLSIGRVAAYVAHDLSNVLTAIRGFASLLEPHLAGGGLAHQAWHELVKAAERGTELTDKLLTVGGRCEQEPQEVDLERCVRAIEPLLRQVLPSRISLRVAVEDGLPAIVGEESGIELVLLNLVVNARDAIEGAGTIVVEAFRGETGGARPGDRVALCVRDSGVGMSSELQERIFDPFFTTKRAGEGTGLGLSFVEDTVRAFGGSIGVDSGAGRGTSVRVLLNAMSAPSEPSPPGELGSRVHGRGRRPGTVLVCQSGGVLGPTVAGLLRRNGFKTVEAPADPVAVRAFCREVVGEIDLVIVDCGGEESVGPALMERIRELRPSLPAIYLTVPVQEETRLRETRGSGDVVLTEPCSPEDLLREVERILGEADQQGVASVH